MRVSAPAFVAPCYYGTDIDSPENLIAYQHSVEEIAELIGVNSLGYLSMEHVRQLTGLSLIHIFFNGNGYDEAWIQEAEKRGLLNLRATPEAMEVVLEPRNMELLLSHKVFSEAEIRSRYEIQLENYCKTIRIEALTMVDMARCV